MKSGIYKITNIINNKSYIGSSYNVEKRLRIHKSKLRKGLNTIKLQNAWNKAGGESFIFEFLEAVEVNELKNKEQYYFSLLNPEYNIDSIARRNSIEVRMMNSKRLSNGGNGMFGKKHSAESVEKMSLHFKEKFKNKENHPMYGKHQSRNSIDKMIQKLKGRRPSNALLTNEQVQEIRKEYSQKRNKWARGEVSYRSLAKKYSVGFCTIKRIIKNEAYRENK
jgi:group I intron endonuclease